MLTIVVPVYWGRPQGQAPRPGDAIFDHPTPLDGESTLPPLLESLTRQDGGPPFRLLVLVAPVAPELAIAAEERTRELLAPFAQTFPVEQVGPSDLPRFRQAAEEVGLEASVINLHTYAGVRNLQLLAAHALDSSAIVALDDDEVVPPDYLRIAAESLEREGVKGAAGFYEDDRGSIFLPEPSPSGNIFQDKPILMNEATRRLLDRPGRWVRTFVAFGGNMLFRQDLFTQVGFDPGITRGEDLDYVLNAHLAGVTFWLDKRLRITHRPPHWYNVSPYAKLAEDVRRFLYQREKLRRAREEGMDPPTPEALMPYPGRFLQEDLEEQALAALAAMATPEAVACWGTPEEIVSRAVERARRLAPAYFTFARRWPALVRAVGRGHYKG